jgi:DnaK suppressor protein
MAERHLMEHFLSHYQLCLLRQKLRRQSENLRETIHQELVNSGSEQHLQLAANVHDTKDDAIAETLYTANLAVIDFHIDELREVEESLRGIVSGNYGHCHDCDSEIDYKRLQAYPTAKRCAQCQLQYEQKQI